MVLNLIALLALSIVSADDAPKNAYNFLKSHNVGMVATITQEDDVSKPYASVMPFILHKGSPVVFISDLAVHTDNLNANPLASFMVYSPDKEGNVFNGARITVTGKMKKVSNEQTVSDLRKDYLATFPDSEEFIDFGDFNYYVMDIEEIYFIGGFGDIGYVDVKKYKQVASSPVKVD